MNANERYRTILSRGFRSRGSSNVRDPEREILFPLLSARSGELAPYGAHLWAVMSPPAPVRLFDWHGLFVTAMKGTSDGEESATDDNSSETVPIEQVPPRYPKELVREIEQWFRACIDDHKEISLGKMVGRAMQDKWPHDHIRLLVLVALMAWMGLDVQKDVKTEIRGDYEVGGLRGDNILFKREIA
jgi:hypothetical protein